MKKQIVSLLLALTLLVTVATPVSAVGGYEDVPANHWATSSIMRATQLKIFSGIESDQFGLGEPITKAAFITALVRLFNWDNVSPASASFSDVKPGSWYFTAVETARANGAIPTTSSTFQPNSHITRQEMTSMIVRGLGYASLAGTLSTHASPFTDVSVNKGFITIACDLGIVNGTGNGKFSPDSTATREQAAAMLVRLYDKLYASSTQLQAVGSYTALRVTGIDTTIATGVPTTPLEPITELYLALQKLRSSGTNMSRVALCLTAGGILTLTDSKGNILDSNILTASQVASILSSSGVQLYYSDRYESAYCIYFPTNDQTATVWYQSAESLAAKLRLARLFGANNYILE